ncbi:ISNCY family transposase, partial [Photorhabdus luminescens]
MAKKEKRPHHDALFKHFLTQPETAREFLSLYLPEEIQLLCDLATLKLES